VRDRCSDDHVSNPNVTLVSRLGLHILKPSVKSSRSQPLPTVSNLQAMASTSSPNSLGLDFDQLKIQEPSAPEELAKPSESPVLEPSSQEDQPSTPVNADTRDKKKPYVNPERVKTGGNQRVGVTLIAHDRDLNPS
jgi:hypothetical protein